MKTRVAPQLKAEIKPFLTSLSTTGRAAKGQLADAYYRGGFPALVGRVEELGVAPRSKQWQELVVMAIKTLPAPDKTTIDWILGAHQLPPRVRQTVEEWWLPPYTETTLWRGTLDVEFASLEEAQIGNPSCGWFYKTTYWQIKNGPELNVSCVGICTDPECCCGKVTTYYDDSNKYKEEYGL
jgi:hypothetical protein